ncbi:MAG: hypothetical protein SPK16_07290, partial [Corynebacterium sp.]|nr:hypothetical protein [Corynebacterium sp.]
AMRALNEDATGPELPHAQVPVYVVAADDETARRICLIDNRANDNAGYNDQALLNMLETLPDLTGTGYTDTDIDELHDLLDRDDHPDEEEPDTPDMGDDMLTIRITLPNHIAALWLAYSGRFDSPEECLEYLLDNRPEPDLTAPEAALNW